MIGLSRMASEQRSALFSQGGQAKGGSVSITVDTISKRVRTVNIVTDTRPITVQLFGGLGRVITQNPNSNQNYDVSASLIPVVSDTRNRPDGTPKTIIGPEHVVQW